MDFFSANFSLLERLLEGKKDFSFPFHLFFSSSILRWW